MTTLREFTLPDPQHPARLPYMLVQNHTMKLYTLALKLTKIAGGAVQTSVNAGGGVVTLALKRTDAVE